MDKATRKICALLESPDNMRRCAAAITIAELAPRDTAVVKALGQALQQANSTLAPYLLEALEATGAKAALPHVMPLLNSDDVELKLRAIRIVSATGASVVPHVKEELKNARRAQKIVLADVLARIHTREAYRTVLDLLFDHEFQVVKETCDAVQRHAVGATPAQRAGLHRQVIEFMKSSKAQKTERVLTSCLLLLGHIGRPEARTVLLKHAGPKYSPYVRRHAMLGLKGMDYTAAAAKSLAQTLFQFLKDSDHDVVRQALDTLRRLPLSGITIAQWDKLLKGPSGEIRVFAARKIAETDGAVQNKRLLALLDHDDTEVSEIAAGALANHAKATALLLDALAKASKDEAAWRIAKILKPHSEAIKAAQLKRFITQAARDVQAGSSRGDALLYFLRNVKPGAGDSVLLQAGMKFKRARKWADAVSCLRRLTKSELFDDDTSYALCVCDLKQSPCELSAHLRAEDHALRGFQHLLRRDSGLIKRLTKDKTLNAAELYYVGFHFSESRPPESEFGKQVLTHVGKTWPRSKDGQAARRIAGLTKPKKKTPAPAKKKAKKTAKKSAGKDTRKSAAKKTAKRTPKKKPTRRAARRR